MDAIPPRSWKDQKIAICLAIRQISDYYGGDDVNLLREYCRDIINEHKDDLSVALRCFEDLVGQLKYMPRKVPYETSQ